MGLGIFVMVMIELINSNPTILDILMLTDTGGIILGSIIIILIVLGAQSVLAQRNKWHIILRF